MTVVVVAVMTIIMYIMIEIAFMVMLRIIMSIDEDCGGTSKGV
jgi:hypothetical protein